MGHYFAFRDITEDKDIWTTGSHIYSETEAFLDKVEVHFDRGIFHDAPIYGCDWGPYYRLDDDKPPEQGVSGEDTAREMAYILSRIDKLRSASSKHHDMLMRRETFEMLKEMFEKAPDHQFHGYTVF
jgi:hypothetical protein